ncbi:MAG: hypothetical protein HOD52_01440, partial [Candidatus Marinimicrobia bacterium]|nr:hypothetical protein [Candidatus Neomarinimicrobiota bacterium]
RGLIYLSKWISGTIFLTVMEIIIIIPFFKFLLLDLPSNFILFSLTSILINFAIMSVASLVAGISMRANFSEVLVPILFFPLVSPVIIAATKISSGVLSGDPYQLWQIWLLIIVSVIVIFPLAGYTLFDFITEE